MEPEDKRLLTELGEKIEHLTQHMQSMNVAEYIELVRSPKYMVMMNFLSGLARGLGVAVGASILGAIVLMLLFRLADLNVPIIGFFVAKIVKIVQTYL